MADFEKAILIILKHEGGYVDHPSDPGGATNRGITFGLFKQYAEQFNLNKTKEGLKQLTEGEAKEIYRRHFWDKMRGNEIKSQKIAEIVFDGYVNMGKPALKLLQKQIGVAVDGIIGAGSIAVLNQASEVVVFQGYKEARIDYYLRLVERKPQLAVFKNGWLNRINSFV